MEIFPGVKLSVPFHSKKESYTLYDDACTSIQLLQRGIISHWNSSLGMGERDVKPLDRKSFLGFTPFASVHLWKEVNSNTLPRSIVKMKLKILWKSGSSDLHKSHYIMARKMKDLSRVVTLFPSWSGSEEVFTIYTNLKSLIVFVIDNTWTAFHCK